jgi:hypothetical protein
MAKNLSKCEGKIPFGRLCIDGRIISYDDIRK